MDSCNDCGSAIPGSYYRSRKDIVCEPCGTRLIEERKRNAAGYLWRGILFAFLGGCLGLLVRWGFEAMFAGDYSFLQPIAALLRFVIFIVVTVLVVVGAKMGSGGRGGTVLQFCAAVFTYLALSLAFVPLILNRMPGVPHTPGLVWAVVQSALEGPFTSVTRNLMNVTGLIAIFFCVALAWAGAAESKLVDGPFDAPGAERTMFKSMG